jgi:hypothetical protein
MKKTVTIEKPNIDDKIVIFRFHALQRMFEHKISEKEEKRFLLLEKSLRTIQKTPRIQVVLN